MIGVGLMTAARVLVKQVSHTISGLVPRNTAVLIEMKPTESRLVQIALR
jgi:hypothetical protein